MNLGVSHDLLDESLESKADWFRSLPLAERMQLFSDLTELILAGNPKAAEGDDARSIAGRVQVLTLPRR